MSEDSSAKYYQYNKGRLQKFSLYNYKIRKNTLLLL